MYDSKVGWMQVGIVPCTATFDLERRLFIALERDRTMYGPQGG